MISKIIDNLKTLLIALFIAVIICTILYNLLVECKNYKFCTYCKVKKKSNITIETPIEFTNKNIHIPII